MPVAPGSPSIETFAVVTNGNKLIRDNVTLNTIRITGSNLGVTSQVKFATPAAYSFRIQALRNVFGDLEVDFFCKNDGLGSTGYPCPDNSLVDAEVEDHQALLAEQHPKIDRLVDCCFNVTVTNSPDGVVTLRSYYATPVQIS